MAEFKTKNTVNSQTKKPEKSGFLGVKRIAKDLKEMPKWFKWFMLGAIIVILFFEFFNTQGKPSGGVNSFFEPIARYNQTLKENNGTSAFGNDSKAAMAVAILYSLNGLASFTGILAISLICYNKISQWFWQIINALFFGLMALSVGSLGDMFMQIIIILGCPLGWYLFAKRPSGKEEEKHGWRYNLIFAFGLLLVITLITLVLYEFLPAAYESIFGKDSNPYKQKDPLINAEASRILDSMTNGFNFVAYVMQVVNINNQFMVWPFVDILKIIKYAGATGMKQFSPNLIVEFCVWLSMCLIGTYQRLISGTKLDIFAKLRK